MPYKVCLQARPLVWRRNSPVPLLSPEELQETMSSWSDSEHWTVAMMVEAELAFAGRRGVRAGSRLWCAVEERVAADVRFLELDLFEIKASIEEARAQTES